MVSLMSIVAQIEGAEWIVVLVVVGLLLFLGPKYIPQLFRSVGRARGEMQKGKMEVEQELQEMTKPSSPQSPQTK